MILAHRNAILAIVAAEVDLNTRYPHWRRRKTHGELSRIALAYESLHKTCDLYAGWFGDALIPTFFK